MASPVTATRPHDNIPVKHILEMLVDIQELLLRECRTPHDFLRQILLKTNEVIGSDIGFIGLAENVRGERYIVIQNKRDSMIGAATGEFHMYLGHHKIGGTELPQSERSFTGYVAHTRTSRRSSNVAAEEFYRPSNRETQSEIAVPILLDENLLGVINLESKKPDFFSTDHERILWVVARLIAQPLHYWMMREGLISPPKEALERITAQFDGVPVGVPFDRAAWDHVVRTIADTLKSRSCRIFLLNRSESSLILKGSFGPHGHETHLNDRRSHTSAREWVAVESGVCFRSDTGVSETSDDHEAAKDSWEPGSKTPFMIVPLLHRGLSIGIIKVTQKIQTRENHRGVYSALDEELLHLIQGQIAAAVQTKRLELHRQRQSKQHARRLSNLSDIIGATELIETLGKAVDKIPRLCGGTSCSIFLWDEGRNEFVLRASNGLPENLIGKAGYRKGEGLTGWVGQAGRFLNLASKQLEYLRKIDPLLIWQGKHVEGNKPRDPNRPFLAGPIFSEGKTIGVIRIGDRKGSTPFTAAEEDMLRMVANHISLTIAFHNRYHSRLQLLSDFERMQTRLNDSLPLLSQGIDIFQKSVLEEAARAAPLRPDAIFLYPFRPESDEFAPPLVIHGQSSNRSVGHASFYPDHIVHKVLKFGSQYWPSTAGIRLHVGDHDVGALFLHFPEIQQFDQEQKELIEIFATQIALLLEISRLYKDTERWAQEKEADALRRQRELDAMHAVDRAIVEEGPNLERVVERLLEKVLELTGATYGKFMWWDWHFQRLKTMAWLPKSENWTSEAQSIDEGIIGLAARSKTSILARDVTDEKESFEVSETGEIVFLSKVYKKVNPNTCCELAVPLLDERRVLLGVLNVEHTTPNRLNDQDRALLELLAVPVIIAIRTVELHEKLGRGMKHQSILNTIAARVQKKLSDPDTVQRLFLTAATAGQGFGFSRAVLFLVERDSTILQGKLGIGPVSMQEAEEIWEKLAGSGSNPLPDLDSLLRHAEQFNDQLKEGRAVDSALSEKTQTISLPLEKSCGALFTCLESGRAITVEYGKPDGVRAIMAQFTKPDNVEHAFVCIPLVGQQTRQLGAVVVDRRFLPTERSINPDDVIGLEGLFTMMALTLENIRLLEQTAEEQTGGIAHTIATRISLLDDLVTRLDATVPRMADNVRKEAQILLDQLTTRISEAQLVFQDFRTYYGDVPLQRKQLNLQALLWDLFRYVPEIKIEPSEEPLWVYVDSLALNNALLEIIKNAREAMSGISGRPKSITIATRIDPSETASALHAVLEISDTGPGIATEDITKVFDPFFSKKRGSGLGLAIAKKVVTRHGGTIEVSDAVGGGARFTIRIPMITKSPESPEGEANA